MVDVQKLLSDAGIIKHSGRLIYEDGGKFYVSCFGQKRVKCDSLDDAKKYIDDGLKTFKRSILNRQKINTNQ